MTYQDDVVLGMHGAQSASNWDRGIARYINQHALALTQRRTGLSLRFDEKLRRPTTYDRLVTRAGLHKSRTDVDPSIYHVMSPFEPIPIERVWPAELRHPRTRLVVTLYDLIPLIFPEHYLTDRAARLRYTARLEMIRLADAVLAISQVTARDAVRLLGIPSERITVIGAGSSEEFVPPKAPPDELLRTVQTAVPRLQPGFFLVTTGLDYRKNTGALIRAFAALPADVRRTRQLVIVCKIPRGQKPDWQQLAHGLGVADRVIVTDYVTDNTLVGLYQACGLFIFPSLYEGCGLPVIEAIRCGAPVIVSDSSSHREIVTDADARFDPTSPAALSAVMARAAKDDGFRQWLCERGPSWAARLTWDRVADATANVYDELLLRSRRRVSLTPVFRDRHQTFGYR